jgi:hypothetical protein
MDYTTLANVKAALGATASGDDALVGQMITQASRVIDRLCSGSMDSDDYLKSETVSDEIVSGIAGANGNILCLPKKPSVTAVSAAAYRYGPLDQWTIVPVDRITFKNYAVTLWAGLGGLYGKVQQVKISYTGGLGAAVANLPADITNAADLLSVRFYREIKSNLTDSIGVAELGTLQYTKAFPTRVLEMLKPYRRIVA